jgi:hypothetical protein
MLSAVIIAATLATAGYLAFSRRLGRSADWRATATPLASIMGSGFLVSAPLLAGIAGSFAIVCMAALLGLAYAVGSAVRFNIRYFEPIEKAGHGPAQDLAFTSRVVLVGAYFISVSFYLQLLAAFALRHLGVQGGVLEHVVTTALLVGIGAVGIWRGLDEMESVEKFTVSLNLGAIGALILALLVHNVRLAATGRWSLPPVTAGLNVHDVRVLLGLLIVVQGFETSRYLGDEHPASVRVRTMRRAQLISAVIYVVFIGLATVLFREGMGADVTAIIAMTAPVAVVLPTLLTVAAIGSQFSAAVADSEGAGGLIEDLTNRRVPVRYAYLLIMLVTVGLTWQTDVNQIIAYASRAFALFYALQTAVAFIVARKRRDLPHRRRRLAAFAAVTAACLAVFILGLPSA